MSAELVLGPLLRYAGAHEATIWVQTSAATTVTVRAGEHHHSARTFAAHGHHYALVIVDGLEPGQPEAYTVELDGRTVWPEPDTTFPPSRIALIEKRKPSRLAFGSCRTSVAHDAAGNRSHGIDALRAYAVRMLDDSSGNGADRWPDLVVFLGDQLYADEPPPEMIDFIRERRGLDEPPGEEIKDFVEYAELYRLAWSNPENRWLLSTLPSAMIFDDHDVRDDWNTSWDWHQEIRATPWWQDRIVGALGSYWIYQHIGNLSPGLLAEDELWQVIAAHEGPELDITEQLDALAARADRHPETYRWSFTRELGDCRLVMVDSRAARVLEPDRRSMLDPEELRWLDGELTGDVRHLFIGTSLPFLLPPGLHDLEAWNEVMAQNGYGRVLGKVAERVRQVIDLEHWAAFNDGFVEVFEIVMSVARGERGAAPATVTFLSGDVHNSYVAEVISPDRYGAVSPIVQAVCSPMRNPMPMPLRGFMSLFARSLVRPMGALSRRSDKLPHPRYPWRVTQGPWFDNNLAICEITGPDLRLRWYAGVQDDSADLPGTRVVADVQVKGAPERPRLTPGGTQG